MPSNSDALEIALNLREAANKVDRYAIDNVATLSNAEQRSLGRAALKLRQEADTVALEQATLAMTELADSVVAVKRATADLKHAIDKLDAAASLSGAIASAIDVVAAIGQGSPSAIAGAVADLDLKVKALQ